ncbi:hypothetical protein [Emticicia sp. SJ17W-69]|uniref:hypothetical protein n=1 Tax=Emticicia sp. SJ17W-69 TaxID=3421657 RepID=UPI003EBA4DC3
MNLITLKNLIYSLSKAEKKSFSLLTGMQEGDKKYLKLYEYLLTTKNIDIENLEKSYTKNGLEAARKHLTHNLMKAIRQAENDKNVENRLIIDLKDAQILHRKGFVSESFEYLDKIKQTALNNELYPYFLMAARLELQYLTRLQLAGLDEFEMIKKQSKIEEILEHEMQVHRHSSLHEILLIRYWRKGTVNSLKEKTKLNDLLLEEYNILNNRNYRSFESQKLHLNFQSAYFMMIGDHEGSLKLFYELDALFQKNTHLWKDSPTYYIYLLDGILTDLCAMERFNEMPFFVNQLKNISSDSQDLNWQIELLATHHQLTIFNQTNQFQEAATFLEFQKEMIEKLTVNTPFNSQAQLCLTIAITHFWRQEYKQTLRFLNFMLNNYRNTFSYQIYVQSRFLFLITQYELANFDYLRYEIRSFERKLKADKQESFLENLLLEILKKLTQKPKNLLKLFEDFIKKIQALDDSSNQLRLFKTLLIERWLLRNKIDEFNH